MVKKKTLGKQAEELKKFYKESKIVIGADSVMKGLRASTLDTVYLSSNCSPTIKADIRSHTTASSVKVVEMKEDGSEIGILCKKPFSISAVGILK